LRVKNISEGWFNFMIGCISRRSLDSNFIETIERRIKICSECPNLEIIKRRGFTMMSRCKSCKCLFPILVYAESKKCPLDKW